MKGQKKRGGVAAALEKGRLVAAFDRGEEGTPVEKRFLLSA
jgi:hypothetical protein